MSTVTSQVCSETLIVIYAKIEGLSANKASRLSELCKREHCHCLCLQETHRVSDYTRPKVVVMTLVKSSQQTCKRCLQERI